MRSTKRPTVRRGAFATLLVEALTVFATAAHGASTVDPAHDCVAQAAAYHSVNAGVLRAILWNESRMNARAVNHNANGTWDVGVGQINSSHFADLQRRGVTPQMLYDPCVSTYVAAWHLSKQIATLGNTWQAVGAYHSRTPLLNQAYANSVALTMESWGLLPMGFIPFPRAPRSSAAAQRLLAAEPSPSLSAHRAMHTSGMVALTAN